MAWGGDRRSDRWKKKVAKKASPAAPNRPNLRAETLVKPSMAVTLPAAPKADAAAPINWAAMLPQIEEISQKYAAQKVRTPETNPFRLPEFPKPLLENLERAKLPTMAMDNALVGNLAFSANQWLSGSLLGGVAGEGLQFLGYTYLAELTQRAEFQVASVTIADDATRKWIDFDVTGDEKDQAEKREKDPKGYDERMADPDERKKRLAAAGKTDKVKELKDDQLRLEVKDRYYEQCRNGGFFGRTHLFHDIRPPGTDEVSFEELKSPIGDSRDETSKTKCQKGWFQELKTIEPIWTYPLMYNAINPLRKDWYNPQVWYVMGQEIHGSRLQTFIPYPVSDMLKPAYAFGGLSLTQLSKLYVDIWLQTKSSVAALIHSFSVMVLSTDMSTLMQPGSVGNLLARVAMANMMRDNQGTQVINKNTEDFKNVSASLAGLHELQAQAQEHCAAILRIPLVKYTGIQPAGLNASSEGELECYDDTIGAYQSP
ncbi:anti-CBASS protein Acb1 family protein, partial [Bradyrhizobium sp.]